MIEAGRSVEVGFGPQYFDDLIAFDSPLDEDHEGEGIVSAAASAGLPALLGVVSPTADEALPAWISSTQIEVAMANHADGWAWRLDEPFPVEGAADGNLVTGGTTSVMTGLENSRAYTVHVALTDSFGDILTPHASAARSFSVGLVYDIPTDTLLPGGIESSGFFLDAEAARSGFVLPGQDEGFFGPMTLSFPINYWGETTQVYINYNGTISFGSPLLSSYGSSLPLHGDTTRVIAPFWADIDTSVVPAEGNTGTNSVYVSERVYNGWRQFVVTWDGVLAWIGDSSEEATFQLVVQEDGRIGIAWNNLDWPTWRAMVSGFSGSFLLTPPEGAMVEGSGSEAIWDTLTHSHLFFNTDPTGRIAPAPIAPELTILSPEPGEVIAAGETSALLALVLHHGSSANALVPRGVLVQPTGG